ncbi:MAG: hypothetical protein JRN68_03995 [Nitrososphaerota archaeon]|nr:hypothetical protein [Nitrososphaerota archaeon]
MKRPRLIADINNLEQAERVETTIKTGYSEPILAYLTQWIAVEEDLANSYEKMGSTLASSESGEVAKKLAEDSKSLILKLEELQERFVALDNIQEERIRNIGKNIK